MSDTQALLRTVVAVIAGFATMAIVVLVGTMVLVSFLVPGGMRAMRAQTGEPLRAPSSYYVMNIALSFLAAIAGGSITQRIATHAPIAHMVALAVVVLTLGAISASTSSSEGQPGWYKLTIPIVGVAGVVASVWV